ncbi:MAG: hypothetical protein ABJN22_12860 [Litorimonas sp.]
MKHLINAAMVVALLGGGSHNATAKESSDCEIMLVQIVASKDGNGEARVPSFVPADDFLMSLKDKNAEHMTEYLGHKIQAVMCRRNDVLPTKADYDVMATGIPFILSQDFDSPDTDSLTLYWKDNKIDHIYKGYPLSEEAEEILETRLTGFSKRGLNDWAKEKAAAAEKRKKETVANGVDEAQVEPEAEKETISDTEDIVIAINTVANEVTAVVEDIEDIEDIVKTDGSNTTIKTEIETIE